ncbi:zinc ribbon domain-containing protein [Cellulosimicrobium arenosum]|uniref:Zinc ribbon domain-containing protein n=2 Tax=Cellulosimicrobium arenosum TaxID=2708133 RepID=A0A927J1Y2_9MICO|nr:zinc ribbon domain-containing protein [Cellulosimicrobium arenosum]
MTCPTCGQANETGVSFCGSCGAYLEWEEPERPAAAEPASAPAASAAVPPAAAASGPVAASVPGRPADQGVTTARPDEPAPAPPAPAPPAPAPAAPAPPAPPSDRGRSDPAPRAPAAVLPGAPRERPAPRAPEPDEPPPEVGDLICGSCGTGNVPSRHFCRRCGSSLTDARVQGRRSWWQRVLHPDRKAPVAGTRPHRRRRRFPTKSVVALVVVGGLAFAGYQLRDQIGGGATTVQDRLQGGEVYNPVAVRASSEASDRPATQLVDGTNDLAWSPEAPGDGVGQAMVFTFDEPFRLVSIVVTGGASTVQEEYLQGSSPRTLDVVVTRADGSTGEHRVTLDDVPGPQPFDVAEDDVVEVRLTIASTYRSSPETSVAVAEVEFRGRS